MCLGLGVLLRVLGRPPELSKPCFPTYKTATESALETSVRPMLGLVPSAWCAVCLAPGLVPWAVAVKEIWCVASVLQVWQLPSPVFHSLGRTCV